MVFVAKLIFGISILIVLIQAILVARFCFRLVWSKRSLVDDASAPHASVILALRGKDPFLETCLKAILNQDYPNYEVKIVIDHPEDDVLPLVENLRRSSPEVDIDILFLEQPRRNCSLKCSSLLKAIENLSPETHMVALLDADTNVHPQWLRELASALQDAEVGAVTGNRWYFPEEKNPGSLIRAIWNSAAVVQMFEYQIAWGGTLALRAEVFEKTDILENWGQAFCDDTMVYSNLSKYGYRLEFVPSLMMVNRERCQLNNFFHWVTRQLLNARLYHPAWPLVTAHGVFTFVFPWATLFFSIFMFLRGSEQVAGWLLAAFLTYQFFVSVLLLPLNLAVRKVVSAREEALPPMQWHSVWRYLWAIPATQWVYFPALIRCLLLRQVEWRGIEYRIRGAFDIEMLEYQPYQRPGKVERTESL